MSTRTFTFVALQRSNDAPFRRGPVQQRYPASSRASLGCTTVIFNVSLSLAEVCLRFVEFVRGCCIFFRVSLDTDERPTGIFLSFYFFSSPPFLCPFIFAFFFAFCLSIFHSVLSSHFSIHLSFFDSVCPSRTTTFGRVSAMESTFFWSDLRPILQISIFVFSLTSFQINIFLLRSIIVIQNFKTFFYFVNYKLFEVLSNQPNSFVAS